MDVGIRELKQNLSAYLERAARGETIRVTDRGLPKAILGPVPGAPRLDQGLAEGWITAPVLRSAAGHVRRARAAGRSEEALSEDRGE